MRLSGQSRGGLGFCGSRAGAKGSFVCVGTELSATNKEHLGFLNYNAPPSCGQRKVGLGSSERQRSHNEIRRMEEDGGE